MESTRIAVAQSATKRTIPDLECRAAPAHRAFMSACRGRGPSFGLFLRAFPDRGIDPTRRVVPPGWYTKLVVNLGNGAQAAGARAR